MNGELQHFYHPWRTRLFWATVYLAILAACIAGAYFVASQIGTHTLPSGQVQLTVPYSKYLVGETISFSIKNNFNSPIYILNNCPSEPLAVYLQVNGVWVRQHDEALLSDCPTEQRQVSIPANGVVNGNFGPWHHLFSQPGTYRVVAFVESYNALPYQDFQVIAKPVIPTPPPAPVVTAPSVQQPLYYAPTPAPVPTVRQPTTTYTETDD